jgi:hypothetical protein
VVSKEQEAKTRFRLIRRFLNTCDWASRLDRMTHALQMAFLLNAVGPLLIENRGFPVAVAFLGAAFSVIAVSDTR